MPEATAKSAAEVPAKNAAKKSVELQRTPLYQTHVEAGGKLVDFAGWQLPVNYGSQIDEHHACRSQAVVFDVSHMRVVDLVSPTGGDEVQNFLHVLLANNVDKAQSEGSAVYSCMLADDAGILDDLIVYRLPSGSFRLVVNAGTSDKDIAWIKQQMDARQVEFVMNVHDDLALLAVQGPKAVELAIPAIQSCVNSGNHEASIKALKRFSSVSVSAGEQSDWFIARTGYTGEDGLEIALPAEQAADFWAALMKAGVAPAGLGARDTLRLEAGLNLYGSDMDESVNPLECGIAWTVAWEPSSRDFIGRDALRQSAGDGDYTDRQLVGLVLVDGKGILRGGQPVQRNEQAVGEITSGTFSPTLQKSIALARISMQALGVNAPSELYDLECEVAVRNRHVKARIVKPPFVKDGKSIY